MGQGVGVWIRSWGHCVGFGLDQHCNVWGGLDHGALCRGVD